MSDQVALETEARISPLINEKRRLFNDLLTAKGTLLSFYEFFHFKSLSLFLACLLSHSHPGTNTHALTWHMPACASQKVLSVLLIKNFKFFISGKIRVFCRTRPLFEDEGPPVVEFPDDCTIRVNTGDETISNPKKDFEFDTVYGPHVGQGEHNCHSLIFFLNCCIWSYCMKLLFISSYSGCI